MQIYESYESQMEISNHGHAGSLSRCATAPSRREPKGRGSSYERPPPGGGSCRRQVGENASQKQDMFCKIKSKFYPRIVYPRVLRHTGVWHLPLFFLLPLPYRESRNSRRQRNSPDTNSRRASAVRRRSACRRLGGTAPGSPGRDSITDDRRSADDTACPRPPDRNPSVFRLGAPREYTRQCEDQSIPPTLRRRQGLR